jgi:inorganic pyrophosphatase
MDFGFVPSTLAEDGDPLDVMVLMDEPCPVGSMLEVRLLGVIEAEEVEDGRKERNDRLLATGVISRLYEKVHEAGDLGDGFIRNLVDFWVSKARLEGKRFTCLGVGKPDEAVKLVEQASQAAKKI